MAHEKNDRIFSLDFPLTEDRPSAFNAFVDWTDHDKVLNKEFAPSTSAKLFNIDYTLHVYVKHDAYT